MDLKLGEEREKYELSVLGMPPAGERMKLALLDRKEGKRQGENGQVRPNERS